MATSTIAQKLTSGLANIGKASLALATLTVMGVAMTQAADAAAMRRDLSYSTLNTLSRNDDGSTGLVNLGFTANFFGLNFTSLFVNNNGNVTFDSALSTFTPFNLTSTGRQIIAPFFGDVDTRGLGLGSLPVTYGQTTVGGRNAFAVNWDNVGYFANRTDKLNQFQLVMIERADTGAGNFDIEFNYDQVQWETGSASGGTNGLGGSPARAGFSNGTGNPGSFFELGGSAVGGAFLDSGPASTRLISNRLNSNVDGRYVFAARNGTIIQPPSTSVPEPSTVLGMLAVGALSAGTLQKRKQQQKANG